MTNAALISELEASPEGTRALSDKMLTACDAWERTAVGEIFPDPTRNLQDAVDLMPEGCGYVVSDGDWSTARASVGWKNTSVAFDAPKFDVRAATPALALVIALLKAMETADA